MRLVFAVILLSAWLILTKKFIRIRKEYRKLFLLLALFTPFLYFIADNQGLTLVSATVGSVIISTIPVFVTIGAWIIYREKLRKINYLGIVISFIGVLIFILNKNGTLMYSLKGLLLMFFGVLTAVGYNLTLNRLVGKYNPIFIVNMQKIIGVILFLPVFLIFDLGELKNTTFSYGNIIPVIELSVFASCGAFILFAFSVQKLGITRPSIFSNCIPVFTALFSFIILGDRLTLQSMAGMLIVIAGLVMSQINGHRKNIDEASVLAGKTA